MAEKLSVIIALEGAEEIKRQLADVGKAGKDCFNEINQAAAEVGGFNKLDPSVVTEKLKETGVAANDVAGVLNAVKQAGRMESLVNGVAAVENAFVKAGTAIKDMGAAIGFVLPSIRTMTRLLVAAFAAAVVAGIVSTTKALLELDAMAIRLGISIGDLAKAQEIFKAFGISSKEAAAGVADFSEAMDLKNVKKAIASLDEFGRSADSTADWFKILTEAARGFGPAAKLAQEFLEKLGLVRISGPAQDIDRITKSAAALPDKLLAMLSVFQSMGNTAERNRLIFANFSQEFATAIIQMLNAGVSITDIKTKLDAMPPVTKGAAEAATRLALAWENLKTVLASPFSVAPGAMDSITTLLNGITSLANAFSTSGFRVNAQAEFQAVVAAAGQAVSSIIQFFSGLPGQIAGFFSGFGANLWDGIVQGAASAWQTVIGWIEKAIEAVKKFFGMGGGQAASAGASAGGFARGGLMGGRGSGTSDSNLAWLSRGEHVMPAYAVRQPGVLQLLEALRRSGGNLRGVLDRMGHFALGGMVGATPAFAGGGMSHVTIAFPGLPPIGGLRAPGSVVDQLHRAAAMAQVRSGGRKPSRYF